MHLRPLTQWLKPFCATLIGLSVAGFAFLRQFFPKALEWQLFLLIGLPGIACLIYLMPFYIEERSFKRKQANLERTLREMQANLKHKDPQSRLAALGEAEILLESHKCNFELAGHSALDWVDLMRRTHWPLIYALTKLARGRNPEVSAKAQQVLRQFGLAKETWITSRAAKPIHATTAPHRGGATEPYCSAACMENGGNAIFAVSLGAQQGRSGKCITCGCSTLTPMANGLASKAIL